MWVRKILCQRPTSDRINFTIEMCNCQGYHRAPLFFQFQLLKGMVQNKAILWCCHAKKVHPTPIMSHCLNKSRKDQLCKHYQHAFQRETLALDSKISWFCKVCQAQHTNTNRQKEMCSSTLNVIRVHQFLGINVEMSHPHHCNVCQKWRQGCNNTYISTTIIHIFFTQWHLLT